MARILLAGATGALGRAVWRELLSRGYLVRRLVRKDSSAGDWTGDLLDSGSLAGCCDGVNAVISCAGASMNLHNWSDRAGFRDVDWAGNCNLLNEATKARVEKFVYVSLARGPELLHTSYARWHERFVEELRLSGLQWSVVRPTGLFSFYAGILAMARKGQGVAIDQGDALTNPIHQADAARACVEALDAEPQELPVGGPVVYRRREIVRMAFEALGATPVVHFVPAWALAPIPWLLWPANPRIAALIEFGTAVSQVECTAPPYGAKRLDSYFHELARDNMDNHVLSRGT